MNISEIHDAHIHLGKSKAIHACLTVGQIEKFRRRNHIDKILVMSLDEDIAENNEAIMKLGASDRRTKGLYWISKLTDARCIESGLANGSIVGAKYHGAFNNKPVTAPEFADVMAALADHGGKLLVHAGRYKEGSPESNVSYFHALNLAKKYPKLTVIMAHMGGSDTAICKRAILESKDTPNVYFDTSGITTPYIIEFALKHLPADRIMFGSDSPWCSFNAMRYNILDANVKEKDKAAILRGSFDKVFES